MILNGALASRADNNDTIDLAVLSGLKDQNSLNTYEIIHFQPFDPVHKRTEATIKTEDSKTFKVTKGVPQVILALSANAEQVKSAVEKAVNEFASRGFRSLGVARAGEDGQWQLLGVLPLFDIAVSGATDAARAAAPIVLTTLGLSVIIDAIKESRRIFQRMNSYAIYRIVETLRVLLFMTAAILIFNFYPLTAVMIVMLALLNDGAILSIAYDNVHYQNQSEVWNMRIVLGIASVLGVIGPIAAFGLFYLGDRVFHLDRPHLQPMMYLMLSVAGHMTIFLTRTRGPFWSIRPARILCIAVLGTQIIATLIAVYGILMPPLGWRLAGFVWGYALIWALFSDRVKLLAYRILDRAGG